MRFTFNAPRPFSQIEEDATRMRYDILPVPINFILLFYDEWKKKPAGDHHE